MANPVVWFEVMGEDAKALRGFYGELFGWSYDLVEEADYGMVGCEQGGIPGGVGKVPESKGPWVTFYVSTKDITKSLDEATKLGGRVVMPRTSLPGGVTLGMFSDPAGNTVGLVEEAA